MDADRKTFVVHVAIREQEKISVHSKRQAHIQDKAHVSALIFNKAPTAIPAKYFNYSNIYSAEYAIELLKHTRVNDHTIEQ